ncbi:MAG: excinuclease ABC subunit UvrB [Bacteroidales bacterium]|jgi:excinuclease ABC subunit B|nr:excinuclease ABC subunit UvrB [Bacteroidales bacterium]
MEFKLVSDFKPTGDQPQAIRLLADGIFIGQPNQVLLGVTGSGKTFTIANVIELVQKPVLVMSHNKTLAAQLYSEFKNFFPENAVEYFVSYYDYYQPEAYLPVTDTYIEKDLSINDEIEKLRLSATSSLLSGRRDVIVVSSVSCIYGIGNPDDFHANTLIVEKGKIISRDNYLRKLVDSLYFRSEIDFKRGSFRVTGDTIDTWLAYHDIAIRIEFWDDEVEAISSFDPLTGKIVEKLDKAIIYPANIFVTNKSRIQDAIIRIQDDMMAQVEYFNKIDKRLEAKRLFERVNYDLEMIRELGHCSGIENYSRYFDGRKPGTRPFCLLDYFPKDFLTIIDESHVTIPQIRAMYGGDRSRKENLVNFGFRLPAALDNRPLKFNEFESLMNQTIYVSATPADFELEKTGGEIVDQVIRPTGLLDPEIVVRPSLNQIDDLMSEIQTRRKRDERILVTTLTKRMAEELTKYLTRMDIPTRYIHSDVDTLDRVEIMDGLRQGLFDVLVGVNLLREGLDLPEVSLVAILDADKEGFLRSERSLTQTAGRAARNINGRVIMYADKITKSMKLTIDETERRRLKQIEYNSKNNIIPETIIKSKHSALGNWKKEEQSYKKAYPEKEQIDVAADPVIKYMDKDALNETIANTKKLMEQAAAKLDFIEAARLRDEMFALKKLLNEKFY